MAAYDKLISMFSWATPENSVHQPLKMKEIETDSAARTAIELAYDIVDYFTEKKPSDPINGHAKTLRRTIDELSERHGILFNGIMKRLSVGRQSWDDTFTNVADEMFADGQYNWGRVVTLYAFAGWLARHCKENRMEDVVPQIATRAGLYASEKVLGWIKSQGGWVRLSYVLQLITFFECISKYPYCTLVK